MRKSAPVVRLKCGHESRQVHRFMDEVYREMFQLEAGRPGAEMGLALALIRARVAADRRMKKGEDWSWLKVICPICLKMIEDSFDRGGTVAPFPAGSPGSSPQSRPGI
jgi:hypothetical protein